MVEEAGVESPGRLVRCHRPGHRKVRVRSRVNISKASNSGKAGERGSVTVGQLVLHVSAAGREGEKDGRCREQKLRFPG
jgi:hypothetical protein